MKMESKPISTNYFSDQMMDPNDIDFDGIFGDCLPDETNPFGLRREMRFISERIICEYNPDDTLSVREVIHPMAPYRTEKPFFLYDMTDKTKKDEFITALDFHEHITYFPYAKSNGAIELARYVSNFNDINFTKISKQKLCSFDDTTIHGLRVGRLDKGMLAVNHRSPSSVYTTVSIVDLVKPARNMVYYYSRKPVNTMDWLWHSPFHLALGDDESLRIIDIRCPTGFSSVFFKGGVQKTAHSSTRPIEITCFDGENIMLYDIRRLEVPCEVYKLNLQPGEGLRDMRYNPYLTNELFVHTDKSRVLALDIRPARLIAGQVVLEYMYDKWQIITFKHLDRGSFATRQSLKRRELMPSEEEEILLTTYGEQYELSKTDPDVPLPIIWEKPSPIDDTIFERLHDYSEYEFEAVLSKTVERALGEKDSHVKTPKTIYKTDGVETFDFVLPGVNGIMCLDRKTLNYKIRRGPKHYEASINPYAGSDFIHFYRGIQIQEMIPSQTLKMMCHRLEDGWDAYQTCEPSLLHLAYRITDGNNSIWGTWLRNSAYMQYGSREFKKIGTGAKEWYEMMPLPLGQLPEVSIPPYENPKEAVAAEEFCKMLAPFFRLFLPNPKPDLNPDESDPDELKPGDSDLEEESEDEDKDDQVCQEDPPISDMSEDLRMLCKCHAKIRYYEAKRKEKKYMYRPVGRGFLIATSKKIREKFFKLSGWHCGTKSQILAHRVKIDINRMKETVLKDLNKFERFKPREFQKRVLPPKLITDSASVFMKPEYIKEREEKEKEMREKASKPMTAPIGMTMTKSQNPGAVFGANTPGFDGEEDPEKARFLLRAKLQLEGEDVPSTSTEGPSTSSSESSLAMNKIPSAFSTISTRENDDFEYETAEDAFFGIKKKRMYVVYQPATRPLGLKRYQTNRLRENVFIRRLEHLVYYGKRSREWKIIQGDYEENHKRLSTVVERNVLDLKVAFHHHVKLCWQTFYDPNFFFSNKCSYNQLLKKAIEMYNSSLDYGEDDEIEPVELIHCQRIVCGIKPKALLNGADVGPNGRSVHLAPTHLQFKKFMNFLQMELPYHVDANPSIPAIEYHETFEEDKYEGFATQTKKTAKYFEENEYMMPKGRLQFCDYDIHPDMMELVRESRLKIPPKKRRHCTAEDVNTREMFKNSPDFKLRRVSSCPSFTIKKLPTLFEDECDEIVYSDEYRRLFLNEPMSGIDNDRKLDNFTLEGLEQKIRDGTLWVAPESGDWQEKEAHGAKFGEWYSPMIWDLNRRTGERSWTKVIQCPKGPGEKQTKETDTRFREISADVRIASLRNKNYTWWAEVVQVYTYPGMHIMDKGQDTKFAVCRPVPTLPKKKVKKDLDRTKKTSVLYADFGALKDRMDMEVYNYINKKPEEIDVTGEYLSPNVHIPIFEEHSFRDIPISILDETKPYFSGRFVYPKKSRHTKKELVKMDSRRALQQLIIQGKIIGFHMPSIEEMENEADTDRSYDPFMLDEDDLETWSEADGGRRNGRRDTPIQRMSEYDLPLEDIEDIIELVDELIEEVADLQTPKKHSIVHSKEASKDSEEKEDQSEKHESSNDSESESSTDVKQPIMHDELVDVEYLESYFTDENEVMDVPAGSPVGKKKKTRKRKNRKAVTWGKNTEHKTSEPEEEEPYVDRELLREIYSLQFSLTRQPILMNYEPEKEKKEPPKPLFLSRLEILRQYEKQERARMESLLPTCEACIQEPWPTKVVCMWCGPEAALYSCTETERLQAICACGGPIYKFECLVYTIRMQKQAERDMLPASLKPKVLDIFLLKDFQDTVKPQKPAPLITPWNSRNYKSGEYTVQKMFETVDEDAFHKSQYQQLTDFFHREFHFITWYMDDVKALKVFASEQFDKAFDRDADIDMMRDTMNTISQDGNMDMMTTYDQRTGMRIRRWISYSALATRLRKQEEKQRIRKIQAEREAKIISGEISIKADMLEQEQKIMLEKEREKANQPPPKTWAQVRKERLDAISAWKKLPIPKFIDDPKKEMPDFGKKGEDWLESSGSEDELPPIRSRILSAGIKEFIATIRRHMENKPKKFDGLRVTYGKLFEKRPILKNDIVLVTKKKHRRRKAPHFRIQRIPLDQRWLNDSLTVSFLPVKDELLYPKDSNKWTVPFYNSDRLKLDDREKRNRAYRPPTPPPTLKMEYDLMKQRERDYYHQNRVNQHKTVKKAKVARWMRFRRKLIGFTNFATPKAVNKSLHSWEENSKKGWTRRYKKAAQEKDPIEFSFTNAPEYPERPAFHRYVYGSKPRKPRRMVPTRARHVSSAMFSDSDSDNCPVVHLSKNDMVDLRKSLLLHVDMKFEMQKEEIIKDHKKSVRLANRRYQRRRTKSVRRGPPIKRIPVSPIQEVDFEEEANLGDTEELTIDQLNLRKKKKTTFVYEDDFSETDQFMEVPVIIHSEVVKQAKPKKDDALVGEVQAAMPPVRDNAPALPMVVERRPRSKSISYKSNSTSNRDVCPGRSFSVDRGSQMKKQLRKLVRKAERIKTMELPKIPSHKKQKSKRVPSEKKLIDVFSWHQPSMPERQKVVRFAPTTRELLSTTRKLVIPSFQKKTGKWSQKLKKMGIVIKDNSINFDQLATNVINQSFKTKKGAVQRRLQAQWLPTCHETDRSEESPSQFQFQHMRSKILTKKRAKLHNDPVRSRVLNTLRKLADCSDKNVAMMFEEPIRPEIAELHLNPWKPMPTYDGPWSFTYQDYFSSSDSIDTSSEEDVKKKRKKKVPSSEDDIEIGQEAGDWDLNSKEEEESDVEEEEKLEPTESKSENVGEEGAENKPAVDGEPGNEEKNDEEDEEEVEPPKPVMPMSWRQMLKKLTNYHVKISRVRLKDMKMFKRNNKVKDSDDFDSLEVMIAPTPNLKSCMMKENQKRKLNFASKPIERNDQVWGFSSVNRLLKTPTSAGSLAGAKTPKPVRTVPSLLKYQVGEPVDLAESGRDTPDSETSSADSKKDASMDPLPTGETQRNFATLRLIKPVNTPLVSSDLVSPTSSPKETSEPPFVAPPKVPADQQWRMAMMSRRNMGSPASISTPISGELKARQVKTEEKRKETPSTSSSKPEEIKYNTPVPLATLLGTRKPPEKPAMKLSEQFLRPSTNELSPPSPAEQHNQMLEMGILPPLDESMWPIEVTDVVDYVPKPRKKAAASTSAAGTSEETPRKQSFFKRLFSSKTPQPPTEPAPVAEPSTSSAAPPATTPPAANVTSPQPKSKSPPGGAKKKSPPLLPRVKRPETGQLLKRPVNKSPLELPTTGEIVKMVDGKPVHSTPFIPRALSQRRPPDGSDGPAKLSSSSSEEELYPEIPGTFETTNGPQEFIDHPLGSVLTERKQKAQAVKKEEPPKIKVEEYKPVIPNAAVTPKTSTAKSVTFGGVSKYYPPAAQEKVAEKVDQPEVDSEEYVAVSSVVVLPYDPIYTEEFMKTCAKEPPEMDPIMQAYFDDPFATALIRQDGDRMILTPRRPPFPSETPAPEPAPSASSNPPELKEEASEQKSPTTPPVEEPASTRVSLITSTRRQLKMADPSPLQLSGHSALPRPAEPSPERPPHLDPPREVQHYIPPSRRKYYTKAGQEWTPEKEGKIAPIAEKKIKKKRRRVKKKAVPYTLDAEKVASYFTKLTAENLALLERDDPPEYDDFSDSVRGSPDPEIQAPCSLDAVLEEYEEIISDRRPITDEEEVHELKVDFDPLLDDSPVNVPAGWIRKPERYENGPSKLRRWMRYKNKRIQAFGVNSSKRTSAIRAVRRARRVKHARLYGNQKMEAVPNHFKPKSILKPPSSSVIWWYRIDEDGNKIYLKSFGPSKWQKKMDEKMNGENVLATKRKPKSKSYLRCWTHVMSKLGEDKLRKFLEKEPQQGYILDSDSDIPPENVIVKERYIGNHGPTRSLSSMSVSSSDSLTSLLDAIEPVPEETEVPEVPEGTEVPETTEAPEEEKVSSIPDLSDVPTLIRAASDPGIRPLTFIMDEDEGGSVESLIARNRPNEYTGLTMQSSSSTGNLGRLDPIETTAVDGSQIVEYVGQVETPLGITRRRFDPFVRPLSALFTALSSTEVASNAGAQSTGRRSRLGDFFRRYSRHDPAVMPSQEDDDDEEEKESTTSDSSAEDVLAMLENKPYALEIMEGVRKKPKAPMRPFSPPEIIPPGEPMFQEKTFGFDNLFAQFSEKKEEVREKMIDKYYDHYMKQNPKCKTTRKLISFNVDEYLQVYRYPRPTLDFDLLGKYSAENLKICAKNQRAADKAAAMIIKKIDKCRAKIEKAKNLMMDSDDELSSGNAQTRRTIDKLRRCGRKSPRKIRVQYKFKKTCVKYRVQVTLPERSKRMLRSDTPQDVNITAPVLCKVPKIVTTILKPTDKEEEKKEEEEETKAVDYDGDDDGEAEAQDIDQVNINKRVVFRKKQKKRLLQRYFQFAVKMARKISRRSLGPNKPMIFYAFINKIRSRMRQFMSLRKEEEAKKISSKTNLVKTEKRQKRQRLAANSSRSASSAPVIRHALKYGNTAKKPVVIEQRKYATLKKNARCETFFECLEEYIDVGTPIRLVYKSLNTLLPQTAFDEKITLVDSDTYKSESPHNTDSDFAEEIPKNPKLVECARFFYKRSFESTYRVKGFPGLIYLARLIQERVGEDIEKSKKFKGDILRRYKLRVFMSPIRRLMLCSVGIRMPDRMEGVRLRASENEKFHIWFRRFYQMFCYGRGDALDFIIERFIKAQGQARRTYPKMDVSYQARVIHRLYKKMIYIRDGREAELGIRNFLDHGIDLERENPFAEPMEFGEYDDTLQWDGEAWTREDWIRACDQFLKISSDNPEVFVHTRASVLLLRMLYLRGYSQDIVDDIVQMSLPMKDKLLFIINLSPPDFIVENIVKVFHTVRGLDRLPFTGLGYHADAMQVLYDESLESGDPQLIAHLIRIGRCLDRRSGEPLIADISSDTMNKRDVGHLMADVLTNGEPKESAGAPTMDEVFPMRYVRQTDGSHLFNTTEELADFMECEVSRYMAILELTKGAAISKGDLDHNERFRKFPKKFVWDVLCTGCKLNVAKGRNLGKLGRTLCVSTMPLIEQDKDKRRCPNAKTMSPKLTFENYIETLDPTENKMIMARDIEEEKTDITVQLLPSRFGCFQCRFELPRCSVCMCSFLSDHMDFALKRLNERFSQFSVCNMCNHGGHVNHIAKWFEREKFCPVAGCTCRCLRKKNVPNLAARLRRHMVLSANMRAKSHLCQPQCGIDCDIDDGFLPDPNEKLRD